MSNSFRHPGEGRGPYDVSVSKTIQRRGPGLRRDDGGERGFTLIEMLVALAIFSLAALALLRLQGGTLSSTARLQSAIVAGIVARNVIVEATTDNAIPAFGRSSGQEVNAGRTWRWTRNVARTGEARLQRIDVAVSDEAGQQAASITAFRDAVLEPSRAIPAQPGVRTP